MKTPTKRPSWATPAQHRLLCKFHDTFKGTAPHSIERRLVWKGLYAEWQKTWTLDTATKQNLGHYFRTHRSRLPLDGREAHGQNDTRFSQDEDSGNGGNESHLVQQSTTDLSIFKPKTRIFPVRAANTLFITIEMPGLGISDITVFTRAGDLFVSAPSETSLDDFDPREDAIAAPETSVSGAGSKGRAAKWTLRERPSGKIEHRFALETGIHAGDIKASLEHGILILQCPLHDIQHRPISLKAILSN